MSSVEEQVLKQVEFYFSNSNLPRDKFLRSLVANDERGYVEIDTIAAFKRMKQITEDREQVVNALKKSTMLEVDPTATKVRRSTPLPQDDTFDERSVYAKGLPLDSTIDSVQQFFQKFGNVQSVRLRRQIGSKDFKGSVIVEFDSIDKAQEVAKLAIKYNESDEKNLEIKMKKDWQEEKNAYMQKRKEEKKTSKKDEEKKSNEISAEALKADLKFDPNCLLKITNIGTAQPVSFSDLKEELLKHGSAKYVDFPYNSDNTVAFVRCETADAAKTVLDKITQEKISFGGSEVQAVIVSGEEEEQYYLGQAVQRAQAHQNKRGKSGRGGRGGRGRGRGGKFGGGRKRKAQNDGNESGSKVAKSE
jgi:lupus La protein